MLPSNHASSSNFGAVAIDLNQNGGQVQKKRLKMHQLGQYTGPMKLKLEVTFFLAEPPLNFQRVYCQKVVILVCSDFEVTDDITREVAIYSCIIVSRARQASQEPLYFKKADSESCLD
jgi:hypothetical protein